MQIHFHLAFMWNMQVDHEGIFWFKKFLAPQYALIELQAYPGALKLNYLQCQRQDCCETNFGCTSSLDRGVGHRSCKCGG
jgi:hypothetical protein